MKINLEFHVDEVLGCEDLDDLSDMIREAIDDKVGETDYMVQDLRIEFELES